MTQNTKSGSNLKLLGIDYGEKRMGLSYGDALGVAVPLPAAVGTSQEELLSQINQMISARGITELVVGYPYNMDGSVGTKAREVDAFIATLKRCFGLPVQRVDERLTTYQARSDLQKLSRKKKKITLQSRRRERRTGDLDSRAATLILQDYLNQQNLEDLS